MKYVMTVNVKQNKITERKRKEIWSRMKNTHKWQTMDSQRNKKTLQSEIEKVPRGNRGEKSSKDMASLRNLVSTIGAQASPKMGRRNQVSRSVSVPCWHATPVKNAQWKPLIIRWRSKSVSRSWNWWKVWLVGKSLWSRVRMPLNILERETSYCWIRSPYRP